MVKIGELTVSLCEESRSIVYTNAIGHGTKIPIGGNALLTELAEELKTLKELETVYKN